MELTTETLTQRNILTAYELKQRQFRADVRTYAALYRKFRAQGQTGAASIAKRLITDSYRLYREVTAMRSTLVRSGL